RCQLLIRRRPFCEFAIHAFSSRAESIHYFGSSSPRKTGPITISDCLATTERLRDGSTLGGTLQSYRHLPKRTGRSYSLLICQNFTTFSIIACRKLPIWYMKPRTKTAYPLSTSYQIWKAYHHRNCG